MPRTANRGSGSVDARGFRSQADSGNYKWLVLILFWLIYFLNHADRMVLPSVFPLIKAELGLSDTQLGILGSGFFWVYALLVPLAGGLGDVVRRKNLVILALLLWSSATFASGMVGGFLLLFVFRALTGTGEAFYYPAANSMISDFHGQKTRSLAMGIHQTSVYFGTILSAALAGYIGEVYGWRWAFVAFGALGIAVALVAWKCLREPVRGQSDREELAAVVETDPADANHSTMQRIRDTFRAPTAVMLMLAFLLMIVNNTAYLTWTPSLLHHRFGLSLTSAGFHATFWHHVGAMLGVLIGGRLADRWALRNRMGRPLIQVAGLIVGAPFIFLIGWSDSSTVVFASLGAYGICRGFYDSNLFASLYEVVRPESRATATGFMIAVAFLFGGSAPAIIGWLSTQLSLGMALASTSGCYLLGGILIALACLIWFRRDAARMQRDAFGATTGVQA
ncbi:MAG: MFS transporter [Bryobacterales bacterium]|jgi:predicted MFS family arabinose efflux permease|nr:MFS transporter [Bryobacterales bacterium]